MVAKGCGIWQGPPHRYISSFPFGKGNSPRRVPPAPYLVPAVSPEQPVGPDVEDLIRARVLQDKAVALSLEHVGAAQLASLRGLGPLHRHPEGVHCGDGEAQGRAEETMSPAPGDASPGPPEPR